SKFSVGMGSGKPAGTSTLRARSRQASPNPSQLRTSSSRSVATSSNAWFMRATLRGSAPCALPRPGRSATEGAGEEGPGVSAGGGIGDEILDHQLIGAAFGEHLLQRRPDLLRASGNEPRPFPVHDRGRLLLLGGG